MCTAHEAASLAGDRHSPIHRLDPRVKVLGLFAVTIAGVCASTQTWFVWLAAASVLAGVAVVARVPPRVLWRRGRIVLGAVLFAAVTIPFVRRGGTEWAVGPLQVSQAGLQTLAGVAAKAAIGTTAAVLLGATTAFPDTLRALRSLRVPALLVTVAALGYRYLFVLGDEVRRTRTALAARGHRPRTLLRAGAIGRVAGALLVRAHARGERVHVAMQARGYPGDLR